MGELPTFEQSRAGRHPQAAPTEVVVGAVNLDANLETTKFDDQVQCVARPRSYLSQSVSMQVGEQHR